MHGDIPLRLSQLVGARRGLLQAAQLANLAFAYRTMSEFAARISRAQLTGLVTLKSVDADEETPWASLTALQGNQSPIEEHFTDEDVTDLADTITYITDAAEVSLTFRIEELAELFVVPLRASLEQAGVVFDGDSAPVTAESATERPPSD